MSSRPREGHGHTKEVIEYDKEKSLKGKINSYKNSLSQAKRSGRNFRKTNLFIERSCASEMQYPLILFNQEVDLKPFELENAYMVVSYKSHPYYNPHSDIF